MTYWADNLGSNQHHNFVSTFRLQAGLTTVSLSPLIPVICLISHLKNQLQELIIPVLKHLSCLSVTCQIKALQCVSTDFENFFPTTLPGIPCFYRTDAFAIPLTCLTISLPFPFLLSFLPSHSSSHVECLFSHLCQILQILQQARQTPSSSMKSILILPNKSARPLPKLHTHQLYFSNSITIGAELSDSSICPLKGFLGIVEAQETH